MGSRLGLEVTSGDMEEGLSKACSGWWKLCTWRPDNSTVDVLKITVEDILQASQGHGCADVLFSLAPSSVLLEQPVA